MTATKEQPNQRQNQPQQDEVGNGLHLSLFDLTCKFLPLYIVHCAELHRITCKVNSHITNMQGRSVASAPAGRQVRSYS